jgi:hypothetical protein
VGEKRVLRLFDNDLAEAQSLYRKFTEKDIHRRVVTAAGKTAAWEVWQEQFIWVLDHLREREAFLEPLVPDQVAVYFGSRLGVPPRAMAKVLELPDGKPVSDMIRRFREKLEKNPSLQTRLDALGIL